MNSTQTVYLQDVDSCLIAIQARPLSGPFERLDGELILLDGLFYQVRANGRVYRPPLLERTPFACVAPFVPDDWMHVYLPEGSNAFATTDLSQDRSRELQSVEK